jgi:hypothetical protein
MDVIMIVEVEEYQLILDTLMEVIIRINVMKLQRSGMTLYLVYNIMDIVLQEKI